MFLVTSSNLLPRCMPDCMYPFLQNHIYADLPPSSLEQFLRAIWEAVFQAIALSKSPNKTEILSSHVVCFYFSQHNFILIMKPCYKGLLLYFLLNHFILDPQMYYMLTIKISTAEIHNIQLITKCNELYLKISLDSFYLY